MITKTMGTSILFVTATPPCADCFLLHLSTLEKKSMLTPLSLPNYHLKSHLCNPQKPSKPSRQAKFDYFSIKPQINMM